MRLAIPRLAVALSVLSATAYLAFWLTRGGPASPRGQGQSRELRAAGELPAPSSAPPEVSVPLPAPTPVVQAEGEVERFDEATLMTDLRQLRVSAPERALARAVEANAAHPDSPGAAERAWIIVRSLEELRRFHEARESALAMRERYPGASWTSDVERHVLIHPLDYPSREAQQAALGGAGLAAP